MLDLAHRSGFAGAALAVGCSRQAPLNQPPAQLLSRLTGLMNARHARAFGGSRTVLSGRMYDATRACVSEGAAPSNGRTSTSRPASMSTIAVSRGDSRVEPTLSRFHMTDPVMANQFT